MKHFLSLLALAVCCICPLTASADNWPDGTRMDAWFADTAKVDVASLGKQYVITDYGVTNNPDIIQTKAIQTVIDRCSQEGGGVVVIPSGTFLTGALFFKPGTHLHLRQGATLKGSDRIENFPVLETRFEGETCKYFAALVNADHVDGFTITGNGTIDGNGYNYWNEFWIRRKWNPQCTNKDAQRPRLIYISNSSNVTVQDVRTINSPVWTNHLYKCDHVRYLDVYVYAPTKGVKAPSSDAIDIDCGSDFLIHGCYFSVNDDGVCIKGGKGTYADTMAVNGEVERVLIQNCHYGTVHSMLTLGSESLHDRNIVMRNCVADYVYCMLHLKMRPDTPQQYEFVTVEGIKGRTKSGLRIKPWTQFFKPIERKDKPASWCRNITIRNIDMQTDDFFEVGTSDKYSLSNFTFENVRVTNKKAGLDKNKIKSTIKNATVKNLEVTEGSSLKAITDGDAAGDVVPNTTK